MIDDGNTGKTVLAEFLPDGFFITSANGKKEKRNEIKVVGRLIAVQRLAL